MSKKEKIQNHQPFAIASIHALAKQILGEEFNISDKACEQLNLEFYSFANDFIHFASTYMSASGRKTLKAEDVIKASVNFRRIFKS